MLRTLFAATLLAALLIFAPDSRAPSELGPLDMRQTGVAKAPGMSDGGNGFDHENNQPGLHIRGVHHLPLRQGHQQVTSTNKYKDSFKTEAETRRDGRRRAGASLKSGSRFWVQRSGFHVQRSLQQSALSIQNCLLVRFDHPITPRRDRAVGLDRQRPAHHHTLAPHARDDRRLKQRRRGSK